MAQLLWRRFFKFVKVFSQFRNYLPLEKGGSLHLSKLESPLPKDALCQVWLKLAQWFWRRRWKCEKLTTTTTDKFWSEKLAWAFGSGELKSWSSVPHNNSLRPKSYSSAATTHHDIKVLTCIIVINQKIKSRHTTIFFHKYF